MGCSPSKSPAPPVVPGKTVHGSREVLDGADWGTRASTEIPADDRHAGAPGPERGSFLERGDVHGDGASVVWRCPAPMDTPAGTRACSPWFTVPKRSGNHPKGPSVEWRLFWSVRDHDAGSCSLYLECRRGTSVVSSFSNAEGHEVPVCFSFGLVRNVGTTNNNEETQVCTPTTGKASHFGNAGSGQETETLREHKKQKETETQNAARASRRLSITKPVVDMVASIRSTIGWAVSKDSTFSQDGHNKTDQKMTDHGTRYFRKTNEQARINFETCSCEDGRCALLADARRDGPGVDMVMAHKFVLPERGGERVSYAQKSPGLPDGKKASTTWGARKFVTCDELRFSSANGLTNDVLVELAFYDVARGEPDSVTGMSSDEDSFIGNENTSNNDSDDEMTRLPPAAHRASRSASSPPSPLGTPEASVQLLSESPLMLVFDNFLTAKECDDLMALAQPDLRRSRVTDGKLSEGRTSSSTFLTGSRSDAPVVRLIERRILRAAVAVGQIIATRTNRGGGCASNVDLFRKDESGNEDEGGRLARGLIRRNDTANERKQTQEQETPPLSSAATPLVGAEPMQVVRYDKGEMYTAHYDNKQGCVRRAATFMMYLNDVETGGATHFPKATPAVLRNSGAGDGSGKVVKGDGVRIWPRRGRALVFWSVRGGVEDARSLHEAESVVQGEKWIATKWLQVAERCG